MFEWSDLRVFLAIYRTRSHAGAARTLRVAPTTIGRRLAALEAAVGSRLFARTPEGLMPTATARALAQRAERVEAEALEAERELTGADARPTGSVRITCADGFAAYVLAPALPAFLTSHPGLSVEVRADIRPVDLRRGEADVALELSRPRGRALVARRLGQERYGIYAAPAYLSRRGTPRTTHDLANHDLIFYESDIERLSPFRMWAAFRRLAAGARVAVRVSNTTTLHSACAAGAGIGLLTASFVRGDPRFVPVLPRLELPMNELWAVTHPDLRSNVRIIATLRWLEQLVQRSEPWRA
jgi:DNA-binding transcriptional LysR family regulator